MTVVQVIKFFSLKNVDTAEEIVITTMNVKAVCVVGMTTAGG